MGYRFEPVVSPLKDASKGRKGMNIPGTTLEAVPGCFVFLIFSTIPHYCGYEIRKILRNPYTINQTKNVFDFHPN